MEDRGFDDDDLWKAWMCAMIDDANRRWHHIFDEIPAGTPLSEQELYHLWCDPITTNGAVKAALVSKE